MTTPIVLIVEDDPDGAESVSEVARDAGFEATTDKNGWYHVKGLPEATVQVNAWSSRYVRGSPVEGTPGGDDVNITLVRFPRISRTTDLE